MKIEEKKSALSITQDITRKKIKACIFMTTFKFLDKLRMTYYIYVFLHFTCRDTTGRNTLYFLQSIKQLTK